MREKKRCRHQHIGNEMAMEIDKEIHNEYGVDEKVDGYDKDED